MFTMVRARIYRHFFDTEEPTMSTLANAQQNVRRSHVTRPSSLLRAKSLLKIGARVGSCKTDGCTSPSTKKGTVKTLALHRYHNIVQMGSLFSASVFGGHTH